MQAKEFDVLYIKQHVSQNQRVKKKNILGRNRNRSSHPEVFCNKKCPYKFLKIHKKTHMCLFLVSYVYYVNDNLLLQEITLVIVMSNNLRKYFKIYSCWIFLDKPNHRVVL